MLSRKLEKNWEQSAESIFNQTQSRWHEKSEHSTWRGLPLLGLDKVVWRKSDSKENSAYLAITSNNHGKESYPKVRMVCEMKLTSHLLTQSAFDSVNVSGMYLAEKLINTTADNR